MDEPDFEFLSQDAVADLNPRQRTEYALYRRGFIDWMRANGRDPERGVGLADGSVENYARRLHQICQWIWDIRGGFTAQITHGQADQFVEALEEDDFRGQNDQPYQEGSKRKFTDVLKKWFQYRHHEYGAGLWEPPVEFTDQKPTDPADFFTRDERSQIYEASLTHATPPRYDNLSPDERDRWKSDLAQRLEKPKSCVRPSDFETLRQSWKIPSLIAATLDGALRPVEIERMNVDWIQLQKGQIQIPKEQAAKTKQGWSVTLRERTIAALDRWLSQRENKEKYDDSNAVWLNKMGNRYDSKNLNYLLDNLLEEAGISRDGRKLVWYSFRKSTAQYVQRESDDLTTASFLRSTPENVKRYAGPTPEEKRDILNNIDG